MKKYYLITTYVNEIGCVDDQQLYVLDTLEDAQNKMKELYSTEIKICQEDNKEFNVDECFFEEGTAEVRYNDYSNSRWWLQIIEKESEE